MNKAVWAGSEAAVLGVPRLSQMPQRLSLRVPRLLGDR